MYVFVPTQNKLMAGESIASPDGNLLSTNRQFSLSMQSDCNMVLYELNLNTGHVKENWATNTDKGWEPPCRLIIQVL